MELLDRYLEAVRKHLPWQRQDDILAELRANLEAQLEEKESALGRPLTAAEAEDWIRQLGSPLQAAAGYRPQQYLIGPGLFPIYRSVLRIVLTWAAIIDCIVSAVPLFARTPHLIDLAQAIFNIPFVLFTAASWITLIFAAIEYAAAHEYLKLPAGCVPAGGWSPGGLPPLGQHSAGGKKAKSFANAVAEVIFGFFALVWLLLAPAHPYLLVGPGIYYLNSLPYRLASVWVPAYWCVVALSVLQLAWNAYHLLREAWQRPQRVASLVFRALGLTPILLLLTAPNHATVVMKSPALDPAMHGMTLAGINRSINLSLELICAIVVVTLIVGIVLLILDCWRKRAAAMK